MTGILKQYRIEIRNILIIALMVMLLPYLPKLGAYLLTTTGAIITLSLMGSLVLAFTLKIYFRILVMRINKDNETVA
ncbi:hypothetical protein L3C95_00665 [Chitinophaga filiformis]|uniref:hypothetical protein n=1 Tax=Chitinophaga filiformis TaxID=104663 RepID=UPI001F340077|nr:hypothetical protein [Chitinophaga filiformis]MCF6401362.1 hypothetical protein [Chitinophaga filiformis]